MTAPFIVAVISVFNQRQMAVATVDPRDTGARCVLASLPFVAVGSLGAARYRANLVIAIPTPPIFDQSEPGNRPRQATNSVASVADDGGYQPCKLGLRRRKGQAFTDALRSS